MHPVSRLYRFGGFLLTFFTAFWVVSNYTAYQNPEEVSLLKESLLQAIEIQQETLENTEMASVFRTFSDDIETRLTEYKYKASSLLKTVGGLIALLGCIFLRRKSKLGIHLFLAGMVFGIGGVFYWHGASISGWSMATFPFVYTLVVSFFIYKKRRSFI